MPRRKWIGRRPGELPGAEEFVERLDAERERARRHGRRYALVVAGVDDVAAVERLLGRKAGDLAREQVGGIIRDAVRKVDTVAQLGPETFGVLLPEEDERGALALAERVRSEVAHAFSGTVGGVTLSLGVARGPGDANLALDLARRLGGDRAVVYTRETAAALEELTSG